MPRADLNQESAATARVIDDAIVVRVPSSTPGKFYAVQLSYYCPCKGFEYRQRCRHLAMALEKATSEDRVGE